MSTDPHTTTPHEPYTDPLAEAQRVWGGHILYWLREGNLPRALACLAQYGAELDALARTRRSGLVLVRPR